MLETRKILGFGGLFAVIILFAFFCSFQFTNTNLNQKTDQTEDREFGDKVDIQKIKDETINKLDLVENRNIYLQDKADSVSEIYVTILKSKANTTTLEKMNNDFAYAPNRVEPKVEIAFQEGTAAGPIEKYFGYDGRDANGTLQIRGHSTRESFRQQSFKIKLFDRAGLWKDQRIINLNKHIYDLTRIRNKLSFDYFKIIPHMTSLRTQFVHLHIKDLTATPASNVYVDYGLFTQIEQPNKLFLKMHGLDPNGSLYKAEYFEFLRYQDKIKASDDKNYDKNKFSEVLEIKNDDDNHKKLIRMLDDVNNYSLNINEVIKRHFNRENYLTWLGVNILFGNRDTNSQNFFLYSPLNSDIWYFLPWDYDGAWGFYNQIGSRHPKWVPPFVDGLGNYWGVVLHRRFLKDPDNLKALNAKIKELTKIINKRQTLEFLNEYYKVASKYTYRLPDLQYLPSPVEDFEMEYRRIADVTQNNYSKYFRELEKPMPIFLGECKRSSNGLIFNWDQSFDFQKDDLYYDFQISPSMDFAKVIYERKGLTGTQIIVPRLPRGSYYWKVTVRDSKGNRQVAFDMLYDQVTGNCYFGEKELRIN